MKTYYSRYTVVFSLTCCSVLPSSCVSHGDISAPNSYSIECDKSRDCIVFDVANNIFVVEPEVDTYEFVGEYLIGHTLSPSATPPGIPAPANSQKAGYFIVNTRNGNRSVGLSEESWRKKLLKLGVKAPNLSDTWLERSS